MAYGLAVPAFYLSCLLVASSFSRALCWITNACIRFVCDYSCLVVRRYSSMVGVVMLVLMVVVVLLHVLVVVMVVRHVLVVVLLVLVVVVMVLPVLVVVLLALVLVLHVLVVVMDVKVVVTLTKKLVKKNLLVCVGLNRLISEPSTGI